MDTPLFVAVDLGAGSGRVFLVGLAEGEFLLQEVRRFRYPPREVAGHLRWDLHHMFEEVKAGYEMFQGYFFCRPEMLASRVPAPVRASYLRLLREVAQADLDFDRIEAIAGRVGA